LHNDPVKPDACDHRVEHYGGDHQRLRATHAESSLVNDLNLPQCEEGFPHNGMAHARIIAAEDSLQHTSDDEQ
jgi:hypothetical protein